ncbi:hypothetical protein LUW77_27030 [Streptomyces radiopugnans]|nr:hypothetical protein LUW77_27030 [Streptomyces radiopugnans]
MPSYGETGGQSTSVVEARTPNPPGCSDRAAIAAALTTDAHRIAATARRRRAKEIPLYEGMVPPG